MDTLLIQNFQSHSKLKIEFDENITTIVGSSDVGKSAVIRALRWLCRNNPQGESFIKDGTKGTTVKLLVDEKTITRKRGKGNNTYLLDKKEFKSFGSDIPDTISKILNLNEINFALQHDPPFWFSLSAGEVSRQLNSIVDLGIIDSSLSAIGKKVRYFQQSIQICKERLQKTRDKKKDIDWVIKADNDYSKVETYNKNLEELHDRRTQLQNTIGSSKTYIEVHQRALLQGKDIQKAGKLGHKCLILGGKRASLSTLVRSTKNQQKILDIGVPDVRLLISTFEKWSTKRNDNESFRTLLENVKTWKKEIFSRQCHLKVFEKDLHKATEGRCPVCGKEMN